MQNLDLLSPVDDVAQNATEIKVFDIKLASVYSDFYVETIRLLKSVDKPSLLENGVEGRPATKRLLDWRSFF